MNPHRNEDEFLLLAEFGQHVVHKRYGTGFAVSEVCGTDRTYSRRWIYDIRK